MIPVVVGLGFGDEGKGATVDALVRRLGARRVVRFNGGPQAAHHVMSPAHGGAVHAFSQLGSGSLVPGVQTALAREMLVDPLGLLPEIEALRRLGVAEAGTRLAIDPRCVVVTPWHKWLGRMRELARGPGRHGSCGRGVGEAVRDRDTLGAAALVVGDLTDALATRDKLEHLWQHKVDAARQLGAENPDNVALHDAWEALLRRPPELVAARLAAALVASRATLVPDEEHGLAVRRGEPTILEGAHGLLLDRERGFWPYVTQAETTFAPADRLLARWGATAKGYRLGVTRAYQTRHGPGPLPTESDECAQALPELHNLEGPWQGPMRCGPLDGVLLRHALRLCGGVDALAVTCLDRVGALPQLQVAVAYEPPWQAPDTTGWDHVRRHELTGIVMACRPRLSPVPRDDLVAWLQSPEGLGTPVALRSYGPTARHVYVQPEALKQWGVLETGLQAEGGHAHE